MTRPARLHLLPLLLGYASARVHSSAAPLSTAGEVPIGLNLDWWGANATNNEGTAGLWDDSSLLVLDLDNLRLKAAVKAFGSSLIRMGGTLGDEIGYDVGEKPVRNCPTQHAPGVNVSYCLSMGRWDELHAWCAELGCRIAFGLNALYGREGNPRHNIPNITGPWDSANTLALLKYTASKGYGRHNTLFGFELGNELQDDLPAAVLAAQYKKLAGYLRELWPDEAKRPWIIGVRL